MKEVYVTDLTTGQEIVEFFMIKSCQIRTGSNGKMYFDLKLGDRTGEVSAKKWDVQETDVERLETYQEGDIIRVKAQVTEWQSAKQLRVLRIRKASAADAIDIREYVQAAPEDSEEMFQYLRSTAESMKDPDFRSITLRVLDENHDQLLYYPAAVRIHHAMYGGLLYHTKKMLMNGLGVAEVYPELDRDL
ncbi:MAG: OB-fold nucleic acid binding domain-containing protein, partial [Eubacteriales bacterium]|nr:OB-fold nucleic acid binding domain-containing protein [Eubacteriales bacterium]